MMAPTDRHETHWCGTKQRRGDGTVLVIRI